MPKKPQNPILAKLAPVKEWANEQIVDNECCQCSVSIEDENEDFVHDDNCIVDMINELENEIHKTIS